MSDTAKNQGTLMRLRLPPLTSLLVGSVVVCLMLVSRFDNPEQRFVHAVEQGQTAQVEIMLEQGANPNAQVTSGDSASCQDAHESDGLPVLAWCLVSDKERLADLLIAHGADVNATDAIGQPMLALAAWHGQASAVEKILSAGADINAKSDSAAAPAGGWTALIHASGNGHYSIARMLIAHGARINLQGDDGTTALIQAARQGHTKIVDLLLHSGADLNAKSYGHTALEYAQEFGRNETAAVIKKWIATKQNN